MQEDKPKKRSTNRLLPLWRDLMQYQNSIPELKKFANELASNVPIGTPSGGLLGWYNRGEGNRATQNELRKIDAEEQYLLNKMEQNNWDYNRAKAYRENKPKRMATEYSPEQFVRNVQGKLPALIKQPVYSATNILSPAYQEANALVPATFGSSYISQRSPKAYAAIDPTIERMGNQRIRMGQPQEYYSTTEDQVPDPVYRTREIPLEDLRQIFSESEWPAIHTNWPERSVVNLNYYTNTPGAQRIGDYYGFKAMEKELQNEIRNIPPITMVMPRPITRPEPPMYFNQYGFPTEDPAVAGY